MISQGQAMLLQKNQQQETVKKIQHYLFNWSNKIGKGSFSQVYLGINERNKQQVAIKVIKNSSVKSKTAQRLLNHQISILKHLDHLNVIKSHDVFSSLNNCYIITQYCEGGDLDKILKKKKCFQEQQISKIVYDTYKALQYLNDNFIIHRDFKIANIFLKNGNYKIADFGFSIRSKSLFTDIPVGSPIYMSPQGLIYNNYGPKTDVWSFGIMIYQLLHGYAPLDKCKTQDQLRTNILKKPQFNPKLSSQIVELIEKCLQTNLSQRISIEEIKQTSYMKKLFSLLQPCKNTSEKLTSTYYSTESNISSIETLFQRHFSYQQALSILHYCRLLYKTSFKTGNKYFSIWLLAIFQGFSKCKIVKSSKSPKNQSPKTQYQNLKQIILQYHQKYRVQYSTLMTNESISFEMILSECTKLYKQLQQNNTLLDLRNVVFMLYKQTQLLNQSFKTNRMDYFAKHSQSKEFLNTLSKILPQ